SVDIAVVQFRTGDRATALRTLYDAVHAYEKLDGTTARDKYIWRILVHIAMNMEHQITGARASSDIGPEYIYGVCSRNPSDGEWDRPKPPVQAVWYELALMEAELGLDLGIKAEANVKIGNLRLDTFEVLDLFG